MFLTERVFGVFVVVYQVVYRQIEGGEKKRQPRTENGFA